MAPHGTTEETRHERRDIRPMSDDLVGRRKPTGAGRTWRRTVHAAAEKMLPANYRPSVPTETRDVPWKVLLTDVWGALGFASMRLVLPCGIVTVMLGVFTSLASLEGIFATSGLGPPLPVGEDLNGFMATAMRYTTVATGACGAVAGLFFLVQKGD